MEQFYIQLYAHNKKPGENTTPYSVLFTTFRVVFLLHDIDLYKPPFGHRKISTPSTSQ
jgi:hypothetical protein